MKEERMKEESMKEESNIEIFYKCDPKKNILCRKTLCQKDCFFTLNPRYSKDGKAYKYDKRTGQHIVDG